MRDHERRVGQKKPEMGEYFFIAVCIVLIAFMKFIIINIQHTHLKFSGTTEDKSSVVVLKYI